MFIIIKDLKNILPFELKDTLKYKGINIYARKNDYYICLDNNYYFIDRDKTKKLELKKYRIYKEDLYYYIEIFVYESNQGINTFKLYKNQNMLISSDKKSSIVSTDQYLKDYYLSIIDKRIITNFDITFNNRNYDNDILKDEDIIEYLGIKIFYFENFLYINGFNIDIKLEEYEIDRKLVKYGTIECKNTYRLFSKPIELNINGLEEYVPVGPFSDKDFLRNICTNMTMFASLMFLSVVNFINSSQNILSKTAFLLMPISMFITGIVIPSIAQIANKNKYKKEELLNKNRYLAYLDKYLKNLKNNVSNYILSHNAYYFDLNKDYSDLFYAYKESAGYLNISLGKKIVDKRIEVTKTNDKDIDEKINEIEDNLLIDNFPVFLDLKENRRVTIISKERDKLYFFNRFLLEICYKHHFLDVYLAVYSLNKSVIDYIYNLPHLFLNDNRLSFNSRKGLLELDQTRLDKPLILFMFDYNDFIFSNPEIKTIYFSIDANFILKESDVIVEYLNNNAYLLKEEKQYFKYTKEDFNFSQYFAYLGKLRKVEKGKCDYCEYFKGVDISENYRNSDGRLISNFAYTGDEILSFDLHEKGLGPHGLIGGSTGSGKSELIVSLLLSLCVNYSPTYLNIVLIDYKGGGIKESLAYKGVYVPHLIACLSNLEDYALERLVIVLKNECIHRQDAFKRLSRETNIPIMNLDDYLEYYKESNFESIAHLLIVVDEFAELRKNHPDEIKELVSLSRIGRSLGLHLILSTQKPAGNIDEEIWSNAHFKIALKLFEEKDSIDLIKRKDAAYLRDVGSFYLQVDDSFIKAQSIYLKNDISNNDPYKVSLLDYNLKKQKSYKSKSLNMNTMASYLVKKILSNYKGKISELRFKQSESKSRSHFNRNGLILGEIDDYINARHGILEYKIDEDLLVFSNRQNEINAFINGLSENKRKMIVIGNRRYKNEYITDSLVYKDDEDIHYLFEQLLRNDIEITLLIEDVYCLLSYDDGYYDCLYRLIRRSDILKNNLIFFSSNTSIGFKIINAFKNKVIINSNDYNDLINVFGLKSRYKGFSFFYQDEVKTFVPTLIEDLKEGCPLYQTIIRKIPDKICSEINGRECLLGYDNKTREKVFAENVVLVSYDDDLLKRYKNAYQNLCDYHLYNASLRCFNNVLWLGPGIYYQNLFISGLKNDLSEEEGIYIKGNKKIMLRIINE